MSNQTRLMDALDQLVHAAAEAPDSLQTTTALAAAVLDLECATGASLGAAGQDSLVVLQRRLTRVHRLLLDTPGTVGPDRVRQHLHALCRSAPAPRAPRPRIAATAAAASCSA